MSLLLVLCLFYLLLVYYCVSHNSVFKDLKLIDWNWSDVGWEECSISTTKIITYYRLRPPPPAGSQFLNIYQHFTGCMGQTIILGNFSRIRELDEMISHGPWIPSKTKTSKSAQLPCVYSVQKKMAFLVSCWVKPSLYQETCFFQLYLYCV